MELTMSLFQFNYYIRDAIVSCVDYNLLKSEIFT